MIKVCLKNWRKKPIYIIPNLFNTIIVTIKVEL